MMTIKINHVKNAMTVAGLVKSQINVSHVIKIILEPYKLTVVYVYKAITML